MLLRVSIGIHGADIDRALETCVPRSREPGLGLAWLDSALPPPPSSAERSALNVTPQVRNDVEPMVHPRDADAFQRGHAEAPAVFLLPAVDEGGQH